PKYRLPNSAFHHLENTILYPSASRLFSSTNTRNYETPTYPASKYDTNAIQSYLECGIKCRFFHKPRMGPQSASNVKMNVNYSNLEV
ncbi:13681_t:CDS:2, partial [Entrophospora sp. SA101]